MLAMRCCKGAVLQALMGNFVLTFRNDTENSGNLRRLFIVGGISSRRAQSLFVLRIHYK